MRKRIENSKIFLADLAEATGGALRGDSDTLIKGITPFDHSEEGHVAFLKNYSKTKIERAEKEARLAALILPLSEETESLESSLNLLLVSNPMQALLAMIDLFYEPIPVPRSISEKADIHPTANLAENVSVGAFVSIGQGAVIEDNVTIHPQVTIYPYAHIKKGTVIHSGAHIRESCAIGPYAVVQNGAVIGADGFGYIPDPKVGLLPVPQVGTVDMGERVEIGANSCVDRGTIGDTKIAKGSKIDNMVQIGHNVQVGMHSIICGLTGVAGSANIGNQVIIGGGSGVADHARVVDGVRTAGRTGIAQDINEKGDYAGFPAIPVNDWKRRQIVLNKLPEIYRELKKRKRNE